MTPQSFDHDGSSPGVELPARDLYEYGISDERGLRLADIGIRTLDRLGAESIEFKPDPDEGDGDQVSALADAIRCDSWVARDFYIGDDTQQLRWGWDRFKDIAKHRTRYFFQHGEDVLAIDLMLGQRNSVIIDQLVRDIWAGDPLVGWNG